MAKQMNDRLTHYYDTEQHRVLCGAPTAEDHSTKHARGITCEPCSALLRDRADARTRSTGADVASSDTGR